MISPIEILVLVVVLMVLGIVGLVVFTKVLEGYNEAQRPDDDESRSLEEALSK